MLAAAVLASWVAQAEPAPPPPAAPVVAKPAPPPPAPDNTLGAYFGWGRRLGSEAQAVGPANGISVGGSYQRRYLTFGAGFELGAAFDFFYDKFQTDVTGATMVAPGQEQLFPSVRVISQTNFALLQTAAWRRGRVRPFVGIGLGATIAYFSSPELVFRPGSFEAAQPFGRGMGGLDVVITHDTAVSLRAGYTLVFTHPTYTPNTTTYSFLGDLFDLDLGVSFQF
jgi:outer membrane protein W